MCVGLFERMRGGLLSETADSYVSLRVHRSFAESFVVGRQSNARCLTSSTYRDKYVMREIHRHGHRTLVALEIRDFQPSDVGLYTCVASNAISREEGYIRLHELVLPTAPPSPPPPRTRPPPPPRRPPARPPSTQRPAAEEVPATRRPAGTSRRPRRPAVRPGDGVVGSAVRAETPGHCAAADAGHRPGGAAAALTAVPESWFPI